MGKLRYVLMVFLLVGLMGTATGCAWFGIGDEPSNADSNPIDADWVPVYVDDEIGDELTAECRVVKSGRRAGISEMTVTNQAGKLIAKATGTTIPVD